MISRIFVINTGTSVNSEEARQIRGDKNFKKNFFFTKKLYCSVKKVGFLTLTFLKKGYSCIPRICLASSVKISTQIYIKKTFLDAALPDACR
jgi:hypothetical protein